MTFLDDDELAHLTGIVRGHARQAEWLKANRIPFLLDSKGRPKVLRATIETILGAPGTAQAPQLRLGA